MTRGVQPDDAGSRALRPATIRDGTALFSRALPAANSRMSFVQALGHVLAMRTAMGTASPLGRAETGQAVASSAQRFDVGR